MVLHAHALSRLTPFDQCCKFHCVLFFVSVYLGLTKEAERSYKRALIGGKRRVPHIRALLCGPGRAGKTSLGRSILRQRFKEISDSTIGVELQKVVCMVHRKKDARVWVWRTEKDEDEQQRLLVKKVLKEEVREQEVASKKVNAGDTLELSSDDDDEGENDDTANAPLSECPPNPPKERLDLTELAMAFHDQEENDEVHPDPESQPCSPGSSSSNIQVTDNADVTSGKSLTPEIAGKPMTTPRQSRPASESGKPTKLKTDARSHFKKFVKEIHQVDDAIVESPEEEMSFVDLWDFAGQESFAAVQHMLLSDLRCAYAVAFDMSLELDAPVNSNFCLGGTELLIEGASIITNFDAIEGWLNTIHQAIGDSDAPVYLIGCKIDKIPADEREARKKKVNDYIWRNAATKAYKHNINDILFVDNTLSGACQEDPDVIRLRQDLIEVMSEQLDMPIPLRWLPFTKAVRHLRKKGMPWLSMESVTEVAQAVCRSDATDSADVDVKGLLQFHHHLGHVLYYANNPQLNDRIIIDVEWLLKIVSLLFVPQVFEKQEKRFRRHLEILCEEGILLESLAQHIWSSHDARTAKYTELRDQRDFLFHLMEEFSLLFNTGQTKKVGNSKPSRKFYIPALVTRAKDTRQISASQNRRSRAIYLFCGTKLLFPQTLFWCLLVRLMKHFPSDHDPVLFRNSARILCFDMFWLVLTYFQHGIKLVVEHERKAGQLSSQLTVAAEDVSVTDETPTLEEACHRILLFAEEQLEELKGDALQHVQLRRAAHCDCALNERPCVKHTTAFCTHIDCRHFVELREGKRPRCPLEMKPAQDMRAVAKCWLYPSSAVSVEVILSGVCTIAERQKLLKACVQKPTLYQAQKRLVYCA